jgi:hypothetical protein
MATNAQNKYSPLFDPTALDGFYSIFGRNYNSTYSYDRNPDHADFQKIPVRNNRSPDQVFLDAIRGRDNGDGGDRSGYGSTGSTGFESQETGFIDGMSPGDKGFSTNIGDLSVVGEGRIGSGRTGIGGLIEGVIGLIGSLTSGSSSDTSTSDIGALDGADYGGYSGGGYSGESNSDSDSDSDSGSDSGE